MTIEEIKKEQEKLAEAIEAMRKQKDELEVAIRRNEGSFLRGERWLEKLAKEESEGEE